MGSHNWTRKMVKAMTSMAKIRAAGMVSQPINLSAQGVMWYSNTPSRYIDKDTFECPEPWLAQKCPTLLGEHQSPAGKFFRRQNFEKNLFLGKKSLFSVFFQHKIVHAASKILKKSWKCVVIVKFYIPLPQTVSLLGYF